MRLFILSLSLCCLAVLQWMASESVPFAAKIKGKKSKKSERGEVIVAGGLGLGVFKDIQVPVNQQEGTRGDGSVASGEFQDHSGVPLHLMLGYFYKGSLWQPMVSIDFLKMTSQGGAPSTQSASYSRYNLTGGMNRRFQFDSFIGFVGMRAHARRSSFNNVSNGHHINAGLIGFEAGLERGQNFKISSFVSAAPISTFAYHTGGFGEKKFKSATSELLEFGIASSFHMHGSAWFDISAEQERALIKIGDVSDYDSFGLAVTPTARPERVYDIATTLIKIGFRKSF